MMLAALLLAQAACGVELWEVKTLTDEDAPKVQLAPVASSIRELSSRPRPHRRYRGARAVSERQVVTIEGDVIDVKHEQDGDLHVVLTDDQYVMIVEFPDPTCMEGSRVLEQASAARERFLALVGDEPVRGQLRVRVTGVVFFDRPHNQTGLASNAVELHPVLAVEAVNGSSPPLKPEGRLQRPPSKPQASPGDGAGSMPSKSQPPPGGCCKVCRASQPCGNSCISLAFTCHKGPGCACAAW